MSKQGQVVVRSGAVVVLGAFLLLIPTFLNGFPFLFQDSADYLIFTPRIYRSPFYGLFIAFFHMNRGIWLPVVAQSLIASHLLWLLLKLRKVQHLEWMTIGLALVLTLFSSLPYSVGFIMPDLFTPVMFITMYVLAFYYVELSWPLRIYLVLLCCVAAAAHTSNLTLGAFFIWVFPLLLRWCGCTWREVKKRLDIIALPIALTAAAFLLFNSVVFGTFSLAAAGSSFLMANLIQYGPGREYLEEACPDAGYKMCALVDELPKVADNLLWDSDALEKVGGFSAMKKEAPKIISATIRRYPGEVAMVFVKNFIGGLMTHEPAAELNSRAFPWASIYDVVRKKFGAHAVATFRSSAEMRDIIPHKLLAAIDDVVTPLSFIAVIALGYFAARKGRRDLAALSVLIICAVIENTLLCTAISGVHDRYQARVTWLLPMTAFVIAVSFLTVAKVQKRRIKLSKLT